MADISYCANNGNCPERSNCRRAQEPPKGQYRVSYSDLYRALEKCEYHWPVKGLKNPPLKKK